VMYFVFEIAGLSQLIADVDIHAKPQNTGSGSREALLSLQIHSIPIKKGATANLQFPNVFWREARHSQLNRDRY
jgi:hypothetical protein